MLGYRKLFVFFSFTIFVLSFSSMAEDEQDLRAINGELQQSISFLQEKKYAEACVKLKLLPDLKNPNNDETIAQLQSNIYYIQGQCFAGLGLYDEAKTYFIKIIERDPEQPRPYLDLAIIYQYLGEFEQAEDTYQRVLNINTLDQEVREKIVAIRNVNPQNIHYTLELSGGGLLDNNLSNSPSVRSVVVYGTQTLEFGENLQPTEAQGGYLGMRGSVNKLLSNSQRLSAKATISSSTYLEKPDSNTLLIDLLGGYHIKHGHSEYALEPRFVSVSLGGEALLNISSIGIRYTSFLNNNLRITPLFEYSSFGYTSASERDVTVMKPSLMLNYSYDDKLMFQAAWSTAIAEADNAEYSYDGTSYDLGARYRFDSDLILSFEYSYYVADYGAATEAFGVTRSDTRSYFNLKSSYNLKSIGLPRMTLDLGLNQYDNASNIPLYKYDRQQVYTHLRYAVF